MTAAAGLLPLALVLAAPPPDACPTVPVGEIAFRAGQFDAWIAGSDIRAGTSDVRWVAGGCALLEDWVGAVSGAGTAIYVHHSGQWHLTYVNSGGHTLVLRGAAGKDSVLFEGHHPDLDGRPGSHRMLFAREGADVRQTWHFRPDATGEWGLLVDIIQRRRPAPE